MFYRVLIFLFALIVIANLTSAQSQKQLFEKLQSVQNSQFESSVKSLSINQMKLTVSNTEIGAISAEGDAFGAIKWPGGANAFKPLIWYDGLQLVGKIDGDTLFLPQSLGAFSSEMQPGKIFDDGTPGIPENPRYRTYKIQRGWETLPFGDLRDEFETDYNQWPVQDGAPWIDVDGDGFFSRGVDQPDYIGDENIFYVANDADSSLRSYILSGKIYSNPFGIEFQVTSYAFKGTGVLGDVVFRDIKMINKSGKPIQDFIVSWFAFLSIGDMPDDAVGIDTVRNFIYGYNRDNFDNDYGEAPPAFGYLFLELPIVKSSMTDSAFFNNRWNKGFRNVEMTNFNYFRSYAPIVPPDPFYDDKYIQPYDINSFFNTMEGKTHNGKFFIDPNTGKKTFFPLAGDPVEKTGWYDLVDGWGGDTTHTSLSFKEFQFALEPFTFEPFDTQRVVIANIAARGEDNINSIVELRQKVKSVRNAYYKNFFITPLPAAPTVNYFTEDEKFTLWWEDNAEDYDEFDLFLENQNLLDTTYTFEGYLIEQYSDSLGSDPKVIKVFDKPNGITVIEDNIIVNGVSVTVPVIFGNDNGITRFININKDYVNDAPLLSGQEYYFGVRAYAFSQFSDPKFKKSSLNVIKIIPGKRKIDYSSNYSQNENVLSNQIEGLADAAVSAKIIDPSKISDDRYLVEFHKEPLGLAYDLINDTRKDTLINTSYELNTEVQDKKIFNGFILLIDNIGKDSINIIDDQNISAVKDILEIKNEEGYLENPKDVLGNKSSNGEWLITAGGNDRSVKENLNWTGSIGYDNYEIRFTDSGSEYYTTGYSLLFFETDDDPKGKGRVPFEIWKISRDGIQEKRMKIKVYDKDLRDTTWTKNETTNQWEMIYAYDPIEEYNEPLSKTSGDLKRSQFNFGRLIIEGEVPQSGTIIRITTFRPILDGDKFEISLRPPKFTDAEAGKENIDEISVFPNPFFAGNNSTDQNFVRFIGLPTKATVRIFTISGQLIRKLEKDDQKKYLDWNVRNESNQIVASGMYIAHVDMPGIGSKILKLAVIPSTEFLDLR